MGTFLPTQLHGKQTPAQKQELARSSVHPSAMSSEIKHIRLAHPSRGDMFLSFYLKATLV